MAYLYGEVHVKIQNQGIQYHTKRQCGNPTGQCRQNEGQGIHSYIKVLNKMALNKIVLSQEDMACFHIFE